MNVSCPECRSVFRIDPAKVPDAGVRARCAVCGAVFDVDRAPAEQPATSPAVVVAPAANAPAANAGGAPSLVEGGEAATSLAGETGATAAVERPAPPGAAASPDGPNAAREPLSSTAAQLTETPAPSEPRARPVNPYLNNTPELRARRLARALVSDLVAYNPQKREQGLRDGTLRQLFRDEIRKSWDEYVEQVGANVAESTPHFQDALNDVLAGGRRVF